MPKPRVLTIKVNDVVVQCAFAATSELTIGEIVAQAMRAFLAKVGGRG